MTPPVLVCLATFVTCHSPFSLKSSPHIARGFSIKPWKNSWERKIDNYTTLSHGRPDFMSPYYFKLQIFTAYSFGSNLCNHCFSSFSTTPAHCYSIKTVSRQPLINKHSLNWIYRIHVHEKEFSIFFLTLGTTFKLSFFSWKELFIPARHFSLLHGYCHSNVCFMKHFRWWSQFWQV